MKTIKKIIDSVKKVVKHPITKEIVEIAGTVISIIAIINKKKIK